MSGTAKNRKLAFISMGVIAVVFGVFMTATLLGRIPPPGAEIVDLTPPDDHDTTECYRCHWGMTTGAEVTSKEQPSPHPQHECANCHEGFIEDPVHAKPQ